MAQTPSKIPPSKLPLPIEATGLRILSNPSLPTHAVLEIDTAANPVRIWLDRSQLKKAVRLQAELLPG